MGQLGQNQTPVPNCSTFILHIFIIGAPNSTVVELPLSLPSGNSQSIKRDKCVNQKSQSNILNEAMVVQRLVMEKREGADEQQQGSWVKGLSRDDAWLNYGKENRNSYPPSKKRKKNMQRKSISDNRKHHIQNQINRKLLVPGSAINQLSLTFMEFPQVLLCFQLSHHRK